MSKVRLLNDGGYYGIDMCVGKIFDAVYIPKRWDCNSGYEIALKDLVAQGASDMDWFSWSKPFFLDSEVEVCEDE